MKNLIKSKLFSFLNIKKIKKNKNWNTLSPSNLSADEIF